MPRKTTRIAEATPLVRIVRAEWSIPRYNHKGSVVGRMQIAAEAKKTPRIRLELVLLLELTAAHRAAPSAHFGCARTCGFMRSITT